MTIGQAPIADQNRPAWVGLVLVVLAALAVLAFIGLGTWQLQRLAWKLDLIETVEARAYGLALAPPRGITSADDVVYQRVEITGAFQHQHTQYVKAVTDFGLGYWVMTPMETGDGLFWINRGFVPANTADHVIEQPSGNVTITGLIRASEPDGTLLEKNQPESERWFSRDVSAFSEVAGLRAAENYFIDADHVGAPDAWPKGGLTRLTFRNSHLSYAITWYLMAVLLSGGLFYVSREHWPDSNRSRTSKRRRLCKP